MSTLKIEQPFPIFHDIDGDPLEDGFVYIGASGSNPETSPVSVFWDEALTVPASQPLRTIGGYLSQSGAPARAYIDGSDYSITVRNKNSTLVWSSLVNSVTPIGADSVDYTPAGAGAVTTTVQAHLRSLDADTYKRRVHKPYANDYSTGTVVVENGVVDGFHRHFGGIAEGENGRLHVFYRKAPEHALSSNTEVIHIYSDDGGQTWSNEVAIVAGVAGFDYRGISVCVTPTGKVLAAYTKAPEPAGSPTVFKTIYSIDNGENWQEGSDVTSINFSYARTFGHIKVIPGDSDDQYRLLMTPYYQSTATPTYKIAAWYSDDDGVSWSEGTAIKDDAASDNELDVAIVSSTIWIAIARSTNGLNVYKTINAGTSWSVVGIIPLTSTDNQVAPSVDTFFRDGRAYILLGYTDRQQDESVWRIALVDDLLTSADAFSANFVTATDMDNASGYQSPVLKSDGTVYIDEGLGFVEFKEYVGQTYSQVRFVRADLFALAATTPRTLTVATGAITVPDTFFDIEIRVGTEGAAATDDLDTINGGREGQIVTFWSTSNSQDTTFKNGTGNLVLKGDYTLLTTASSITLIHHGGSWYEMARGNDTAIPATIDISAGVLTVPSAERITPLLVGTEGSAATDDLDTINGGLDGQIIICRTPSASRDVTYKDGTGNLSLAGDFLADNGMDTITLVKWGATWYELARSNNG